MGKSYKFDCPHYQINLYSCIYAEGIYHSPDRVFSVCLNPNP